MQQENKIIKKLLLILLCAPLLFTSCSKDDDNSDLIGVWHFQGPHDLSGEFINEHFDNLNEQACVLMSYIELNENGFGRSVSYFIEDQISGPCYINNEFEFQWEQTNSTTLVFSFDVEAEDLIFELVSSTQLQFLMGEEGENYYHLFELFE